MPQQEALRDFRNFLYLVWKHLGLPSPTPIQYDIAHYLQHGPRRSVIQAFRGVGKSWITDAWVLWRLYWNNQHKIEIVSASKNLADNSSTFCLQLIESMPLLRHLRPKEGQRESKIQFDVGPTDPSKDPSVKSVGITGQLTGTRADDIVADDVETPNNSLTQGSRDKLSELVKEFDSIIKPNGNIKYLGTPQTEQSIYNVLEERGYEVRIWPSRYPDERQVKDMGHRLAPSIREQWSKEIVGQPTDNDRFDEFDLAEREVSYGRSGFALQFMLDTSLSDADRYPLKLSDLIVMDIDDERAPEKLVWARSPELACDDTVENVGFRGDRYYRPLETVGDWIPYTGSVLFIDPSGRGSDETGYAVTKMLNGYLYVPEAGGLIGGYNENTLVTLANIAKRNKVSCIVYENNFGDGMFGALLKPVLGRVYPCTLEEIRHSKQKELRIIDTLEPVLNRHRLVVDPKVINNDIETTRDYPEETRIRYQLFWQLSRITKDRGAVPHDDRLDALAGAVAYWVEQMSQDEDKRIGQRKAKLRDDQIRRFLQHAIGGPKVQNRSWINPPNAPPVKVLAQ